MYDAASRSDLFPALQRARGALRVSFRLRDHKTVLAGLRQDGALKARFPRPEPAAWTGAVMLNSSGGVAGGDVLSIGITVENGARATVASQAAERIYRALPGSDPAVIRHEVVVGEAGGAEWLPQETILFDTCALDRQLHVSLAPDAWFLGVEALIFGRTAMGEVLERTRLRDVVRIRRDGRLVLHDAIRIEGACAALLGRAASMRSARALATIYHAAPDAECRLEAVRDALGGCGAEWGASAWDGLLVVRLLAENARALREAVVRAIQRLRAPRPLPRVWLC